MVQVVVERTEESAIKEAERRKLALTPAPPTEEPKPPTIEEVVVGAPPSREKIKFEATAYKMFGPEYLGIMERLRGEPPPELVVEPGTVLSPEAYKAWEKTFYEHYGVMPETVRERLPYVAGALGGFYEAKYGAEAEVMRGLVTEAFEGKEVPSWARIWEPAKPFDASQIQASFLGSAVPSPEVISRQHLKDLVLRIMGLPIGREEKIKHIRMGILKPSEIWQPPPSMVPAEAEAYFGGMPPKWYLGEAPTPGELQLQKVMEKIGESLAYSGTVWYGVKESPVGKIPLLSSVAVGLFQAAEPWAKALAELTLSIKKGGPLLTGKVPILHEGPVFTMGVDRTVAERLGYIPGGFPAPKPPGLISLETLGGAIFYAGLFAGAAKITQLGLRGGAYGFKAGARGTEIITKPLRAVTQKIGPAAESELAYLEFQLAKASASVKGAMRGIFTTEPFYYYPRAGPAGPPTLTPVYKALDAMKQRLGIPKFPTVVRRAGRPGELARYRLGGLVKYEYVKPAPSITGYWDVPITKFGGVSPLPSELVWVRDSARITTQLNIIFEKAGLREVQAWYKIVPTGKAKPILYQEYLQSLRRAVGKTVSGTRLSGFEAAVGKKVGTGYYWSLERLGVTPAERAMGWFGIKTRGEIFPKITEQVTGKLVWDEQLVKYAAAFKKDSAMMGFVTEKAGIQASTFAGGVRSHVEKLMDFLSYGRFRVGVSGGAPPVGDGVLRGYGQFARAGQQLLLAQESALGAAWGPWLFPESSQLGLTVAGLGVGIGTAIGTAVGAGAATSAISGLKAGALPAAGVRQVPRMGQVPFFELAPFQAQFSGAGVAQAQAVAQVQKQMQVQMQRLAQVQASSMLVSPFVWPREMREQPFRPRKITKAKFRPFERVWPVGRIEKLFERPPKVVVPTVKARKGGGMFDVRGLEKAFRVPKTRRRRRRK